MADASLNIPDLAAAFNLFNQRKYNEAYPLLLKCDSLGDDQVAFALGFLHEYELVEGANPNNAKAFYEKSATSGNIEAALRLAYVNETSAAPDPIVASKLYQEVTGLYNPDQQNRDTVVEPKVAADAAFAYYRLGVMCEKGQLGEGESALSYYEKAAKYYEEFAPTSKEYAQVWDRIGWLSIPAEYNSTNISQLKEKLEKSQQAFQKAKALGFERAQLGLLNIDAIIYSDERLADSAKLKTSGGELAKYSMDKSRDSLEAALRIDQDHTPTLLKQAYQETYFVNQDSTGLDAIRKVLKLEPDNQSAISIYETIIKQQSRYLGVDLQKQLSKQIKDSIRRGNEKGATTENQTLANQLQKIFYPDAYNNAYAVTKLTYSQQYLDNEVDKLVPIIIAQVVDILNHDPSFRDKYRTEDKDELCQELVQNILKPENLSLCKAIVKSGRVTIDPIIHDHITRVITDTSKELYAEREKQKQPIAEQMLSFEDASIIASRKKFVEQVCEKFRVGRNSFEAIARGQVAPLPDKIADAKYYLDRGMLVANCPPFSYLGNMMGGNSWIYAATSLGTDLLYKKYKDGIVAGIKQVDTMLPRGRESEDLMQKIAAEMAAKYGPQLANMKEEDIEKLSDAAVERMMNYALSQTSNIKTIKNYLVDKANTTLDYIIGTQSETTRVDPEQLLKEGLVKGSSQDSKRFIRTKTEAREFADGWTADGLFNGTGVMTSSKRIFGDAANIAKYGCMVGTVVDAELRSYRVIDQATLDPKLKKALSAQYDDHSRIEQLANQLETTTTAKPKKISTPNLEPSKTKLASYSLPKAIAVAGLCLLGMAIAITIVSALSILAPVVPGLIFAGAALIAGAGIKAKMSYDHNKNYAPEPNPIAAPEAVPKAVEKEKAANKVLDIKKIDGPAPPALFDNNFGRTEQEKRMKSLKNLPEFSDALRGFIAHVDDIVHHQDAHAKVPQPTMASKTAENNKVQRR